MKINNEKRITNATAPACRRNNQRNIRGHFPDCNCEVAYRRRPGHVRYKIRRAMTDSKAKIIGRIQPGPLKTRLVIHQNEGALTIALEGDVAAPPEKPDNADARPAPTKKP